jgi:two-component system, LuxR family, response regulator FixJ
MTVDQHCDSASLAPPAPTAERPIFVIDDDPAILASLKFALEIEGYAVHTYTSAKALIADATHKRHGCLVLDYNLAEQNGLQVLAELRQRGVTMPAIMITTNPGPHLRVRAAAASVSIVEKPLMGNTLIDAIHTAFPD